MLDLIDLINIMLLTFLMIPAITNLKKGLGRR